MESEYIAPFSFHLFVFGPYVLYVCSPIGKFFVSYFLNDVHNNIGCTYVVMYRSVFYITFHILIRAYWSNNKKHKMTENWRFYLKRQPVHLFIRSFSSGFSPYISFITSTLLIFWLFLLNSFNQLTIGQYFAVA